jgi:nicotinamidase-related amidase
MLKYSRRFLNACVLSGVAATVANANTMDTPAMGATMAPAMTNTQPTIRAMFGATPIQHLERGKTALLVIDFQNEYFTGRMPIPDGEAALANTRKLIDYADSNAIPVYHVQHVEAAGSPVFAMGGETVKFHPLMQPRSNDVVVQKDTVSVFASTDLDDRLKAANIDTLIVTGLMTHACVAAAAREAAPKGYKIVLAADATATRAITRYNGATIDKDSLHSAALTEIEDTFGDVLDTADIQKLPVR